MDQNCLVSKFDPADLKVVKNLKCELSKFARMVIIYLRIVLPYLVFPI
jgi:hypothetical protein